MVQSLFAFIRKFAFDRKAGVAVVFGLTTPIVIGGGVYGLEVGTWYYDRVKLQQAADAGAYAAGIANLAGQDFTAMQTAATEAAANNGFDSSKGSLTLHTPPTTGSNQNTNSTEVLLTRTEPQYFTKLFGLSPSVVHARSVTSYVMASNACILALDQSASRAVQFSGSSTVTLNGCSVMSDSIAADSIYSQGATNVTLPCLLTAGGVQVNTYVHKTD
jgi:Flp pilus assembly protein TadG